MADLVSVDFGRNDPIVDGVGRRRDVDVRVQVERENLADQREEGGPERIHSETGLSVLSIFTAHELLAVASAAPR